MLTKKCKTAPESEQKLSPMSPTPCALQGHCVPRWGPGVPSFPRTPFLALEIFLPFAAHGEGGGTGPGYRAPMA